jgi:hypothetical protein
MCGFPFEPDAAAGRIHGCGGRNRRGAVQAVAAVEEALAEMEGLLGGG